MSLLITVFFMEYIFFWIVKVKYISIMKISIPQPCNENWHKMLPSEKGKFCLSCQKEVIDFSVMSKNDIKKYFKALPKNVWGRIEAEQLSQINISKSTSYFKPLWFAASLLVLAKGTVAQGNNMVVDSVKPAVEINESMSLNTPKRGASKMAEVVIHGKIIDKETGETLPFVNVEVKELNIGTSTDFDGKFTLKIPPKDLESVELKISYLGYENYDTIITQEHKEIHIELAQAPMILKGEVLYTVGGIHSKPSVWRRIGYFFKRIF